jgi:hypothetical protein
MKKILIFVIGFLLFFQVSYAQRFSLGCKGGLDLVNIRYDPASINWGVTSRLSYDLGLVASYSPVKILKIQLESGFVEKGGQLKFKNIDEREIYKFGYLSNQFLIILKPISKINLEFGAQQGHTLYGKTVDIPGQTSKDKLGEYKKNDYSAIIGLGFNFLKNFTIDCRYIYGFTPLKDCFVIVDPGPSYSYEMFNKYISIGISYYFLNFK